MSDGLRIERVVGRASDYQQLLDLFRARATELNVSRDVLDEVSGLGSRYVTKLLGPNPVRKIGMNSLGALLGALGVRLELVEDAHAMAQYCKRAGYGERSAKDIHHGDMVQLEFSRRHMQKIGRKGGEKRRELPKKKRQKFARMGGLAAQAKRRLEASR